MTSEQIRAELGSIADRLVPVAGTLMMVACRDEEEHLEGCECLVCRAFLGTQGCINRLEALARALEARGQ
jgi:hypothetical protein